MVVAILFWRLRLSTKNPKVDNTCVSSMESGSKWFFAWFVRISLLGVLSIFILFSETVAAMIDSCGHWPQLWKRIAYVYSSKSFVAIWPFKRFFRTFFVEVLLILCFSLYKHMTYKGQMDDEGGQVMVRALIILGYRS